MSKERKMGIDDMEVTYTYRCSECKKVYTFSHVQTYANCNACEWRGELRLRSIETDMKEADDE